MLRVFKELKASDKLRAKNESGIRNTGIQESFTSLNDAIAKAHTLLYNFSKVTSEFDKKSIMLDLKEIRKMISIRFSDYDSMFSQTYSENCYYPGKYDDLSNEKKEGFSTEMLNKGIHEKLGVSQQDLIENKSGILSLLYASCQKKQFFIWMSGFSNKLVLAHQDPRNPSVNLLDKDVRSENNQYVKDIESDETKILNQVEEIVKATQINRHRKNIYADEGGRDKVCLGCTLL